MNNTDFIDMIPGAMGQVSYRMKKNLTPEQYQKALSEFTKRRFSDYINRLSTGSLNGNIDPMNSFSLARNDAHKDIELLITSDIKTQWVQIGQDESIECIIKLENQEDFICWENPYFISMIKNKV
jgi:hypothetical protein